MLRRRLPLLIAVFGLSAAAGAPASSADSISDRKQQVDSRIAALRADIASERKRERVLTTDIDSASSEIEALERRIDALTGVLAELEAELAAHRARLALLEARFREQTRRLEFLGREYTRAQRILERRLVDLYEVGDTDEVEILLQVEDLNDLIEKLDYFDQIGSQDERIASTLKRLEGEMRLARRRTAKTKSAVEEATAVLARKTDEERQAQAALVSERSALESARASKRTLLASVREDRHEDEEDLAAMEAASASLAATIQAAQASASAAPSSTGASASGADATPSASGFVWPVSGPVTSGFGPRWGRMHAGIDIGAPIGTPVRAAAAGTVIYAGGMGGYGNIVVVDHGGGLATAYAHLSAIWIGGGTVAQGTSIGAVGCTGSCTGPHLHFEVRVNGSPGNPLGYL